MAESASSGKQAVPAPNLADRVETYRRDVDRVVREVGEHPQYEMKRSCSLSKLAGKIEFVKDIQSIATSKIETEKYLVIGADDKAKAFCPVDNLGEFDEASVRQILDKYLSPVPAFQIFQLQSSEGHPFVLFVLPRQPNRRILAKVTIFADEAQDAKQKLLLREGDLWTKGSSTGKRLAKAEDWDEIYEEMIEEEAERRARVRTAHTIELAIAREKLTPYGRALLPSVFTDEEFQALMEDVCSTRDESRFKVLLERLRDDTVEGWHRIGAYEDLFASQFLSNAAASMPDAKQKVQDHIKNVFRPAMRWLTLAAIYTIKNGGPNSFVDLVADLLKEVFETTHKLQVPRAVALAGQKTRTIEEHVSHTVPALESLISLHLTGAYIAKRNRFEYLRSLFRGDVYGTDWQGQNWEKRPMAFWPLDLSIGHGEPDVLRTWGGRLKLCAGRVRADSAYGKLFGSERATIEVLCQYELCLELNSFLAMPQCSPETGSYVKQAYPDVDFVFRPQLIAFSLLPLHDLVSALFAEIKKNKPILLKVILFEPVLAGQITKSGGDKVFGSFLDSISKAHGQLWLATRHFPPDHGWPPDVEKELKRLRDLKA
jgi:hypothetical protein